MQRLLNHGDGPTYPLFPTRPSCLRGECARIVPGFAISANSESLKPPLNSHERSQAVEKN
jgi:hypothetical protein